MSMLNWRRDPDYELRMQQLESDILRVRSDSDRIERETEQLKRENARLAKLNARDDALSALIRQHCFPPESSSTPALPIASDSSSS